MAEYGVDIALRVTGEDRLNKVLRVAGQLENRLKAVKAIDITAPGAGKLGDDIRKALKPFQDLARESVNTNKGLKNTQARMQALGESFQFLASNAKIGSAAFKNFTIAADNQSRALKKVALEQENIIRSARGMQSVEERQIQLARRQIRLLELRAQREREVSFEKRLQDRLRQREIAQADKARAVTAQRQQRSAAVSSAVIGGAFPLLFGQGAGAALGGAIGGGVGARFGQQGGFAGSLVGTFAGQATLDFAINSAIQLARALQRPTENIQELVKFLGIAGTQLDANITTLQKLGMESSASAVGLSKLEEVLTAEGYKNIDTLSKDLTELENAFGRLKLAAANILSEPLTKFLDWLTDTIKLMSKAGGVGGFITTSPQELQRLNRQVQKERLASQAAAVDPTSPAALQAQKLITEEQNRQLGLLRTQVQLEFDRTGLTRVGLAARQGDVQILTLINRLEKINVELQNEKSKAKRDQLSFDKSQLELQKQLAEAARRSAVIEAQRQVDKERLGLYVQQAGTLNQINNLVIERQKLTGGELIGIQKRRDGLQEEQAIRTQILIDQREAALIGVNELDIREEISKMYDGLATQLAIEIKNRRISLDQQEAQYNLTQLQIRQQRELANLQTQTQMGLELAGLQAGTDPRFFGVFGGSRQTQELMGLEMQARLGLMRTQLSAVQTQAAVPGLAPDELKRLQQQSQALEDQIGIYERYQPAIINASVAQQRFNEVLALTTPVVDSVFESITAVAEGTKTAQQAFADFLMGIANMLMDTVKQMIAQYIALGIARQFAGISAATGGGGGASVNQLNASAAQYQSSGLTLASFGGGRATGGPVSAGTPYLVGERGPELFVPGAQGNIVPNSAMGGVQVGSINITVENTGEQLSPAAQKQIANQVQGIVMSTLVNERRSGGVLR